MLFIAELLCWFLRNGVMLSPLTSALLPVLSKAKGKECCIFRIQAIFMPIAQAKVKSP